MNQYKRLLMFNFKNVMVLAQRLNQYLILLWTIKQNKY